MGTFTTKKLTWKSYYFNDIDFSHAGFMSDASEGGGS